MEAVLRGLLPNHNDRYYYALERLDNDSFLGSHKDLWKILCKIFTQTGMMLDSSSLSRVIEASDNISFPLEKKVQVEELWERLAKVSPLTESDFRVSVEYLVEVNKSENLGNTIRETAQILDRGLKKGEVTLHGLDDAVSNLHEGLAKVETGLGSHIPEGNVRDEEAILIQELQEGSAIKRFATGTTPIDEMTHGGPGTGELWVITSATRVGKSLTCGNWAHNFVINGNNVLYLSLETQRAQIRRRLLVRHARMEQFGIGGISLDSLNKHTITNPSLTDEEVSTYLAAAKDFAKNPAYGSMIIAQVPENTKFSTIRAIANRWNNKIKLDVIIVDSFDLVGADVRRPVRRDELNEVILGAKGMAMTFDDGRGVPVITPWQTSRSAQDKYEQSGRYDITALGETSEVERRADCIIALGQQEGRPTRLKAQTLKWRDGKPENFELKVDYDHCYLGSEESLNERGPTSLLDDY
jgi:replicative DNA helicase